MEDETMKGKKIKQINNLTIRYTEEYQYSVWTPDGRCWEDRMTLEQAEEFCRNTKDFVSKQNYCFIWKWSGYNGRLCCKIWK